MVNEQWKQMVWGQLGGALDMLENAIAACPDEIWRAGQPPRALWYVTYHTLFFLDLYTYGTVEGFAPPAPFTLDELNPDGVYPDQVYSRDELGAYLRACRDKCRAAIVTMTDETAARRCRFEWVEATYGDLLLGTMRHVQHHTAQLNWVLGETGKAPRWVRVTNVALA
jgi:hypothetical protein